MKITIYTVTDCQFSKQEKEYLTSHTLQFEEKNLETNKEWLTEMLTVGSNFAGTPVTKIEKDDGQTVVLKGFTKEEFDKALGFAAPEAPKTEAAPVAAVPAEPPVAKPEPAAPAVDVPPVPVVPEPVVPPAQVPAAPDAMPPVADVPPAVPAVPAEPSIQTPAPTNAQLDELLNSLQTKAEAPAAPAPVNPVAEAPVAASAAPTDAAAAPQIPAPNF